MQIFAAVLCLAAVALARPQNYGQSGSDAVTTVTERTFTIRGNADKYYGSAYGSGASSSGSSNYASGSSGSSGLYSGVSSYAAAPAQSYSFQTVATAQPVAQQAYYQQYAQAAPVQQAYYQQSYQAAPVQQAYYQQSYQAAPAVAYQAAPAVAFQAVTAAPAVAYQTASVAPAVYQQSNTVGIRAEGNYENSFGNQYETSLQQSQVSGGETKVYKHVYAFAAPEEPATRARISVQAPVSKRKHYKLVFIKAPSQQTVVDSDITLPAQEEEKTLIYVLSKNQKQAQPEIRIKQAEASKHAKPEVFFLKYKNEAEAQSIASGAINGQNANVPANGEIISDGSVSILGQSSGSGSGSSFGSSSFGSGSFGSSQDSSLGFDNSYRSGASNSGASNVVYRGGFSSGNNAGLSAVSAGSVGLVAAAPVVAVAPVSYVSQVAAAPAASSYGSSFGSSGSSFGSGSSSSFGSGSGFGSGSSFGSSGAGLSGGFSAYNSQQEPASVSIKVTSEPAESFESSTSSGLSL